MEERLQGTVAAVIYKNEDTGYTVAKLRSCEDEVITVVGNMPALGAGESLDAVGEYMEHPQYGRQFTVRSYERSMPSDSAGIYEYLATGAVRGIGVKTAQAIVERFGENAFDIIASEPEKLCKIRGISYERAVAIQRSFLQAGMLRTLIEFLAKHHLPAHFAAPLAKRYGGDTVAKIMHNPYLFCEEPFLMSFQDADRLAADFHIDGESAVRLSAAILYELLFNLQGGHVFIPEDKLLKASASLCGVSEECLAQTLDDLCEKNRVVRTEVGREKACYLEKLYRQEITAAREVRRLCEMEIKPPKNLEKLLAKEEKRSGMQYAEKQKQAITQVFSSAISIITGGPGTGKTTALLTLVKMLEDCGFSPVLAAPTGRAADRLGRICEREAKTLHRLLETAPDELGDMTFKRNANNPLDADAVIIDEASMLDLNMSASLLEALKPHARLVLVGDADQLPPVGAGRFFSDLLESGCVPSVRLNEIFRQAQKSDIVVSAHKINHGEMPELRKNTGDFYFSSCSTPQRTAALAAELITSRIPEHFAMQPSDIQIICPSRRNICGTEELNVLLQEKLNPPSDGKKEVKSGRIVFRVGDRVMQIKNNYDRIWFDSATEQSGTGVYNGDTGTVELIEPKMRLLRVRFEGKSADYPFSELEELEHAFAITAHKSQGSEYRAVIIPVFDCPPRLLSRNLLYTAVTRAKELLVVCGREDRIEQMVVSGVPPKRYGALKRRLRGESDV